MKYFTIIKENSIRVKKKCLQTFGEEPLYKHLLKKFDCEIYADIDGQQILDGISDDPELGHVVAYPRLEEHSVLDNATPMTHRFLDEYVDDDELIVLLHVTSPFIEPQDINDSIKKMIAGNHDSVLTVDRIQAQSFTEQNGMLVPINFDWRYVTNTQDLNPIYYLNHAFYVFSKATFKTHNRIGVNPLLWELGFPSNIDINTEEDLTIAKMVHNYRTQHGDLGLHN